MDALASILNREKKYPDVYFFYGEDSEYKYIHYDNYDYLNDDTLKSYVIEKALELYDENELEDFLVTYKEVDESMQVYLNAMVERTQLALSSISFAVTPTDMVDIEKLNLLSCKIEDMVEDMVSIKEKQKLEIEIDTKGIETLAA